MAVPGPVQPEVKTQIVFVGSVRDELLTMVVDQKAATVEKFPSSGLFELTRDGVPVWVNVANVLYLEPVKVVD
jgi:hypothetical protein